MSWNVEFTHEFEEWWNQCSEALQDSVSDGVRLLEELGPHLPFPRSSAVVQSRHPQLRELRVQYRGKPHRILYAFDPRRVALLLLGGGKAGDDRWYDVHVPIADKLYDQHLLTLKSEGLL